MSCRSIQFHFHRDRVSDRRRWVPDNWGTDDRADAVQGLLIAVQGLLIAVQGLLIAVQGLLIAVQGVLIAVQGVLIAVQGVSPTTQLVRIEP